MKKLIFLIIIIINIIIGCSNNEDIVRIVPNYDTVTVNEEFSIKIYPPKDMKDFHAIHLFSGDEKYALPSSEDEDCWLFNGCYQKPGKKEYKGEFTYTNKSRNEKKLDYKIIFFVVDSI